MPPSCQIILFSATFPAKVREFAARFAPDAALITLKQEELSVDGIKQFFMDCNDENHKVDILQAIYGLLTIGQSIIFVKVYSFHLPLILNSIPIHLSSKITAIDLSILH